MSIKLRPFQVDAVDAVKGAWQRGIIRPAVVLPTGSGKTVVIGGTIERYLSTIGAGRRILVLAHRTELVEHNAEDVADVLGPGYRVGIVKAQRNQVEADIVSASVQTLASVNRRRMLRDVGLVVVDECHHATAQTYQDVLKHYGCYSDGGAVAVGLTATLSRGDGVALGDVWQDVVYTKSINWMIDHVNEVTGEPEPYLVRPKGKYVRVDDLDFSKVRKVAGDYSESQLGAAIEDSMAPEAIVKAYREHASERRGMAFLPTVASATLVRDAFMAEGFEARLIHGGTPRDERREALRQSNPAVGNVQVLVNCMVLTEGTNLPWMSCVVIARPTAHPGLYIQMVGRVLRLFPGKTDALVLDVVGATHKHSLTSPVDLFGEEAVIEREKEPDDDEDVELIDVDEVTHDSGPIAFGDPGNLIAEDVDLFSASGSAWLITNGGVWFIPAGERYIVVVRGVRPATFDVASLGKKVIGDSRWIMRGVSDRGFAMAWAEGDVTVAERVTASKARAWRAMAPTFALRSEAQRHGVVVTRDMLSGEVSNKLTIAQASARIDPNVPAYARG